MPRKSELMRIEMAFLSSIGGFSSDLMNWSNHWKMLMSQCTQISMSSDFSLSFKYASKYFMCSSSSCRGQRKSLVTYLASSNTVITSWSLGTAFSLAKVSCFLIGYPARPMLLPRNDEGSKMFRVWSWVSWLRL